MLRLSFSSGTPFLLFACFVIACNSPVTNHNSSGDTSSAAAAGTGGGSDSSASGGSPADAGSASVSKQLTFNKITYSVKADGANLVVGISSPGVQIPDSAVQPGFSGILYDAAIADLDNDRQPEIYAFTRSQGSNNYGSVFGVAFRGRDNRRISFADLTPAAKGYAGQDSFYVDSLHRLLVRQFPVVDSASQRATPVVRTIKYELQHNGDKYLLSPVKR